MSTHRHVKKALDDAIAAHKNNHRHHLQQAGLEQYTEQTASPLGPAGDMGATPEADNG